MVVSEDGRSSARWYRRDRGLAAVCWPHPLLSPVPPSLPVDARVPNLRCWVLAVRASSLESCFAGRRQGRGSWHVSEEAQTSRGHAGRIAAPTGVRGRLRWNSCPCPSSQTEPGKHLPTQAGWRVAYHGTSGSIAASLRVPSAFCDTFQALGHDRRSSLNRCGRSSSESRTPHHQ